MDTTSTPHSSSPTGQQSVSAFFEASGKAEASVKALTASGYTAEEIIQTEQNGGYLVTVDNPTRAGDATAILKEHGGSIAGDFSDVFGGSGAAPVQDGSPADDIAAQSVPVDSGLSEANSDRPAGGDTFTSGSLAGGSGGGTASGGSLFGSSR